MFTRAHVWWAVGGRSEGAKAVTGPMPGKHGGKRVVSLQWRLHFCYRCNPCHNRVTTTVTPRVPCQRAVRMLQKFPDSNDKP